MALNLIDLLERLLGSNEVLSRIGALIGLSPERTKTAIGAAVPAILAGLVGVAQRPEGRNQLAALVQGQDTSLLDNLAGALGGGREQSLIDSGKGMLSSLLGQGQFDELAGAVGKFAGLNQSSAGSLLGALAPAVMGALGREQRSQGLDAQGLARMLSDQKDSIAHALPAGLASALASDRAARGRRRPAGSGREHGGAGRPGDGRRGRPHRRRRRHAGRRASARAQQRLDAALGRCRRWPRWRCCGPATISCSAASRCSEAADPAVETAGPGRRGGRQNLMVGDVDVGQQVTGWFDGATKTLNGVTDAASAEAALPKLNELGASLDKVGGLVEQLPAEGKSALAALVSAALPNLEALIAKVNEIPGAGDVIKPVADSMLEKLRAMTA